MTKSLKTVLITQSNYIPWKGYFDAISRADEFIILDEVQYTRRDWRNRNKIVTPHGLKWLTIPVSVKGKFHQKINETRISDPNWGIKHWNTIRTNYSKAPHFAYFADMIENLYLECNETKLSAINQMFIVTINQLLGIETVISRCEDYGLVNGKNRRLIDLCIKAGANNYLTGRAAENYLDVQMFSDAQIRVHWLDYKSYPEYPQLSEEFVHGVSILDLLFNTGPRARSYMSASTDRL